MDVWIRIMYRIQVLKIQLIKKALNSQS